MSAEGSVRVSAVPIPRVEIVQAGVYALLDIDMRPIVGDILSYSNCVIAVAGADDIIDIIYKNYHVYSNKFKMALINVRIGYDENIAVRVRVGYMNPRQYNSFNSLLLYLFSVLHFFKYCSLFFIISFSNGIVC